MIDVVFRIPTGDFMILGGDLNGHVGALQKGKRGCMGGWASGNGTR